jgi:hypothetical protein
MSSTHGDGKDPRQIERLNLELEQRVRERTAQLEATVAELQQSMDKIKVLQGLLPICSHCGNIRSTSGSWETLESYVRHNSDAEFSHGVCPPCLAQHYPELRPR